VSICWLSNVPFDEQSCRCAPSLIFRADRACGASDPETLVAFAFPSSVGRADGCGSSAMVRMIVWHIGGVVRAFPGGLDAVASSDGFLPRLSAFAEGAERVDHVGLLAFGGPVL
jgi:hypothetical protein